MRITTVYNDCSNKITVKAVNRIEDVPPTNVVFDDLAQESIGAANNTATDLGKAIGTDRGFRFKVTRPDAGQMKIGLYNTSEKNPWANGYVLLLTKGSKEGAVNWNVKSGANENAWTAQGEELTDVPAEMEVYAWLSDVDGAKKLNVIIAGTRIVTDGAAADGSCGEVTQGTYMSVYNETNAVAVFTDLSETNVVPGADVSFEDLAVTKKTDSITLKGNAGNDLGAVSSVQTGFQFRVTKPTGGKMKVGLYNASADNVWDGGYLLFLEKGSKDGSVKWTLCGAGEAILTYGEVGGSAEEMLVSVWMSADNKLNLIIDGKRIVSSVDVVALTEANRYMAVYNECSNTITVSALDKEDEDVLPTDIIFDDLSKENISAVNSVATSLGKIVGTDHGFRFKVTRPDEGRMKIGLYNTSDENPWADGYVLMMERGSQTGAVNWNVRSGANESAWAAWGNELTDVPAEMEVYAWLRDVDGVKKLNIQIAGKRIVRDGTAANGGCGEVAQGTYMSVYNEQPTDAVFKTLGGSVPNPDPEPEPEPDKPAQIPSDVIFEDLGQTVQKNMITMSSNVAENLGQLGSTEHGFKVKVGAPKSEDVGKNLKIGLYNTQKSNPWTDGYILCLSPGKTAGSVNWAVRLGNGEGLVDFGSLTGISEEIEVYVWLSERTASGHKLNIAANGKQLISRKMDSSVTLGNYLSAYSEWKNPAILYTYENVKEANTLRPVNTSNNPEKGVRFDDLLHLIYRYEIKAPVKEVTKLGQVGSLDRGLKFRVTAPGVADKGNPIKIGFYNTIENNPWGDGYLLVLKQGENSGEVGWSLLVAKTEDPIASGTLTGVKEADLTVMTWLADRNAAGHTIHVVINGKEIVVCRNDGSIKIGTYMAAYNDLERVIQFKSAAEKSDLSEITFEDLGVTARMNEVAATKNVAKGFGQVKSRETGFQFNIAVPTNANLNKNLKVGLYNTDKKNPWADGYILVFTPRGNGNMSVSLIKGKDETRFVVIEDLANIEQDGLIAVSVWITDLDKATGSHTIHIMINEKELIAYPCEDGSVLLGRFMSVYNEWDDPAIFHTITRIETLRDRYLKRFGDPTSIETKPVFTDRKDPEEPTIEPEEEQESLGYVIGIVAAAVVVAGAIVTVVIIKRKKKEKN